LDITLIDIYVFAVETVYDSYMLGTDAETSRKSSDFDMFLERGSLAARLKHYPSIN
jgi:hypothetical protein